MGIGNFQQPYRYEQLSRLVPGDLRRWNLIANAANRECGQPENNCIGTSHALAKFLGDKGREAGVVRVSASVFPPSGYAVSMGSDGSGERRRNSPGGWHGHLAVECEGYLLDPTVDQAVSGVGKFAPPPTVVPLPFDWERRGMVFVRRKGTLLRWNRFHLQNGWRSQPIARPGQWMDIVEMMEKLSERS